MSFPINVSYARNPSKVLLTTAFKNQPKQWEDILFRDCSPCMRRLSPQDARWPTPGQGLVRVRQAMLAGLQSAGPGPQEAAQDQSPGTAG